MPLEVNFQQSLFGKTSWELPFEKVVRNIIRARFLRPGPRPYRTQNIYAPFAGKEVSASEHKDQKRRARKGR